MADNIELGVSLTADGKGFVGAVKISGDGSIPACAGEPPMRKVNAKRTGWLVYHRRDGG